MALTPGQVQQQAVAVVKGDMAPVFQQLSLSSLKTRTQDLHAAIGRILHAFHSNPSTKWSEVLSQFAMVNVELLNLVEDIKPVTKMYVVYPKNVNAENSQILPIMLSTKLLPEMETEEETTKEQILREISSFPTPVQTEKLQKQIELVRSACDNAEKVITEARKVYGLGTRQGPVALPTLDKVHASRIAEQEKLLRVAANYGDGLRIPAEQPQPAIVPQHLSASFPASGDGRAPSYLGADGGFPKASLPNLPPSGLRSGAQQQAAIPQLQSRVQTPTQSAGGAGLAGASPSQMPYMVNSPKSGGSNFNAPSPQQSQPASQQSGAVLQRTKVQQQQLLRQQQLQQLQMRRPATPPITQSQLGVQSQAQVAQPLVQQQKQQLQQQPQQQPQQNQNRLPQQYSHQQQPPFLQQQQQLQQERQPMHHMHHTQQQQNLQQQLQSSQLQSNQNTLQGNQVRTQLGQLGSIYGTGTQSLLSPNVMASISQPMQSQNLLQQRVQQFQQGNMNPTQLSANQPQQNVPSMLSDSLYNIGVGGAGAQLTQSSPSLGLPMQQQQLPQANYMTMFNNPTQSGFIQNRQQQPPS